MSHLKDIKVGYQAIGSLLKESGEFRKDYAMGIIDTPVVLAKSVINIIDKKLGCTQRRYNVSNAVNDRLLSKYGNELSDMSKDVRHLLKDILKDRVTKTYGHEQEGMKHEERTSEEDSFVKDYVEEFLKTA